jgi:hypothetical protein
MENVALPNMPLVSDDLLERDAFEYNQGKGIRADNEAIATHQQLDSLLIPLRDGLWFSRSRA